MHSSMPHTTQPNWNNEETMLSYESVAAMDLLTDDMVAELMDPRNDTRPSTRPTNIDENYRRSTRIGQASACGIHHRFHRSGQNQG